MPAGDHHPFQYPLHSHKRRHAPPEFKSYGTYKDYLRDEFVFSCVYCLSRETWCINASFYGVDHYFPKGAHPDLVTEYANLVYACNECNRAKGTHSIPEEMHPESSPYGNHLTIHEDGSVESLTDEGKYLVDVLHLNRNDRVRWRRRHLELHQETITCSTRAARRRMVEFFGFPVDMPQFHRRPGANSPYGSRDNLPAHY